MLFFLNVQFLAFCGSSDMALPHICRPSVKKTAVALDIFARSVISAAITSNRLYSQIQTTDELNQFDQLLGFVTQIDKSVACHRVYSRVNPENTPSYDGQYHVYSITELPDIALLLFSFLWLCKRREQNKHWELVVYISKKSYIQTKAAQHVFFFLFFFFEIQI